MNALLLQDASDPEPGNYAEVFRAADNQAAEEAREFVFPCKGLKNLSVKWASITAY